MIEQSLSISNWKYFVNLLSEMRVFFIEYFDYLFKSFCSA